MSDPAPSLEEIEQRLRELTDFVSDAIRRARGGEIVDISRMDNEVARLCDDIDRLEIEKAFRLETPMAEMIGKLDELAVALNLVQDTGHA